MKKHIIVALFAALILSLTGLAGCNNGCGGNPTPKEDYYVISDFESQEEFFTFSWHNEFGKASLSEDTEYVTSGNGCLELEIWGNVSYGVGWRPYFTISTDTEFNNRTDYSMVERYEMDVYNASDRDVNMYFQFNSLSLESGGLSSEEAFLLKAGQMNHIEIDINRDFVAQFIDISQIGQFIIRFDNRQKGETPAHLYMDRFVGKVTDKAINPNVSVRQPDEIESADKAEYLSAWVAQEKSGTTLSFNTDKRYIIEGEGSFKWSASALGYTEWPRLDLVRNSLLDISGYESIYFWIYNDNDEDYSIVIGGKTIVGVAVAGEWTLIEMTTDFLSKVMNFYDTDYEYDLTNFDNLAISTTNHNKNLTFYIDAFYARKAGDPIRGENPAATEIQLSQTQPLVLENGESVSVPTVLNPQDFTEISWTVCEGMQPSGSAIYSQQPLDGVELNAASFTTKSDNYSHSYAVKYSATDLEGRKAKAVYNVITVPEDSTAVPMTSGDDLGERIIESVDSRRDGCLLPDAALSGDYAAGGESSVHITADQAGAYAFTYDSFNMNQCDDLYVFIYNDGDKTVILESFWGLSINIEPGSYAAINCPKAAVASWLTGAPDISGRIDAVQFSFYLGNVMSGEKLDLYFSFVARNYSYIEPVVPGAELSFDGADATVLTEPVTLSIGEEGDIALPTANEAVTFTWATYFNDGLLSDESPDTITCSQTGTYTVVFTAVNGAGGISQITYTAYFDDGQQFEMTASDPAAVGYTMGFDGTFTGEMMDGISVLKMQNEQTLLDAGFVWNTGITSEMSEISFYFFNASDANLTLIYHWGVTASLKTGTWTKVSIPSDWFNASANGAGSQVVRDTETGEWKFIIHFNESQVAGGNVEVYMFSTAKLLTEPEPEIVELPLPKTLDVAEWGSVYTVPQVEGATYTVEVIFGYPQVELVEGGFKAMYDGSDESVTYGEYLVTYTKPGEGNTVQIGYLTVFVEYVDNQHLLNLGADNYVPRDDGYTAMSAADGTAFLGYAGLSAVKLSGTAGLVDYGMLCKTGVTADCEKFIYYIYNASSVEVNHTSGGGALNVLKPHSWNRVECKNWLNSWPEFYKENGGTSTDGVTQWIYKLHFKFMGESTTGYDLYFVIGNKEGTSI